MMSTFLNNFLKLDQYTSASARNRALLIYANVMLMVSFLIVYFILIPSTSGADGERITMLNRALTEGLFIPSALNFYGLIVLLIGTFALVRFGRIETGSWALVMVWLGGGIAALVGLPSLGTAAIAMVNILVIAVLMLQERGLVVAYTLVIVSILGTVVTRSEEFAAEETFIVLTQITVITLVLYLFLRFFRLIAAEEATEAVDERVKANELLTEATYLVAERAQLTEIARKITRSIIDAFDYLYQARLYMIDESNVEALLVGSMLGDNPGPVQSAERVSVGSLNALGEAAISGQIIVRLLEQDQVVDVVLPMKIGTRVVGLLNLRTRRRHHFEQLRVQNAFKALADSTALILDNVSQFERAEARVRENDQLVERTQEALREVERLNQRLTGSAWTQFLRSGVTAPGLAVDFDDESELDESGWTKSLSEAAIINHLVQEERDNHQVIAVPLRVRGQVIGAMEFELDANYEFTPEDLELVQDVSERFGLAVENTRLVQESQRVAQREALVNQISARLQSANDVNVALTEAARGLRDALKANRVAIKLGEPTDQSSPVSENTGKSS